MPVILAPLLAASLLLSGCGGEAEKPKAADPTPSVTPTPEPEPITSPLTGAEVKALPKHPVIVTKIDNTRSSSPQVGLSKADMVVEELVEGGMTRLAVFFHSRLPELAGPVRSMRASDIGIVSPVDAKIITSGAATPTIARIQKAEIQFFQEGAAGIFRESSRSAPYNLFANPREIGKKLAEPESALNDYFAFGDAADLPAGKPATSINASFGGHVTNWTFADGAWSNVNSYAGADDQFVPDNIVVLQVRISDAGYTDPTGAFVPESHLAGSGSAYLFRDGRMIKARWKKPGPDATITLMKGGEPLGLPAGKTFVELVPEGQGSVTFAP